MADGQTLYILTCDEDDWGRVRRSISRLKADYFKVRDDSRLAVVLNKPHPDSELLDKEDMIGFLDGLIPITANTCPVSTSRKWDRTKNNPKEYEYKTVLYTWLTLEDQIDVAKELGAELDFLQENRWQSPEDVDADKWQGQLIDGIRKRETEIEKEEEAARRKAKLTLVVTSQRPKIREDIL